MKKYLFLTILLIVIFLPATTKAATEFISTIQQTGGDYSTLSSWEGAIQSNLIATTTRVFSGTGTGKLSAGDTVTCVSGGAHNGITARVVATTSSQILLDNATSSTDVVLSADDKWQKDASHYWTVSGTGDELGDTAIAIAKIDGAWTSADETAVEITGWETDSTHYIKIYTTEAARHNGKWGDEKYRHEVSVAGSSGFLVSEDYVKVLGLQIKNTNTNGRGITYDGAGVFTIAYNIVIGGSNTQGIHLGGIGVNGRGDIYNNIVYDSAIGIRTGGPNVSTVYVYNNTVSDCSTYGIEIAASGATLKNNLVQGAATNYSVVALTSEKNISEDATSPDGAYRDKTVLFTDEANDDFHLAAGDTVAKNAGTNLYSDANLAITDDIDGDTRPASNWDIGADEEMTAVEFVSTIMEGTNGDYHSLNEWEGAVDCDLTASSTRVYSFDGTSGWIGDGVEVYIDNGNATATLIHAASSSQALLIDIQGSFDDNDIVTDGTNDFTLSDNGAPAIATAKIDGTWTNPDTTAVTINDWTTATSTYIRIYTTETARHNGVWDDGKYRLEIAEAPATYGINIQEEYVRIEGLQIKRGPITQYSSNQGISIDLETGEVHISHCIIRTIDNSSYSSSGIYFSDVISPGSRVLKIWNNIIYDWHNSDNDSNGIYIAYYLDGYVFNNTIYNCDTCFRNMIIGVNDTKNNIAQNCIDGYFSPQSWDNSDYNISDIADDTTDGSNDQSGVNVSFADEANDDFHLAGSDTAARDAGVDLSGDSNLAFDDDIDGQSRPGRGAWDIGADEAKAATRINTPITQKYTDGLVGHWTFNGEDMDWASTTAEALDRSGNSNNGNVVNFDQTSVSRGKVGQALEFDGVDDYINIPNNVNTYLNMTNGTIGLWYKANTATEDDRLYEYAVAGDDYLYLYFNTVTSLRLIHRADGGTWDIVDTTVPNITSDTNWHYVVATWDVNGGSETLSITFDGERTSDSDAITTPAAYSGTASIGATYNGGNYWFNGTLDEFRIYDRALSADEIGDLYQAGARKLGVNTPITQKYTSGLVGHWTFNGEDMDWASTTAEVLDRSGQGNNGNVTNFDQTSVARGQVGQGLEFDGSDDSVEISDDDSLDGMSDLAVSLWVKFDQLGSVTGAETMVIKTGSTNYSYKFLLTSDDRIQFQLVNQSETAYMCYTPTSFVSTSTWYHIAGVYPNGQELELYLNGSPITEEYCETPSGNIYVSDNPLDIGSESGSDAFDGLIDEVRIYNRALSADEVMDLYQAGARKFKLK